MDETVKRELGSRFSHGEAHGAFKSALKPGGVIGQNPRAGQRRRNCFGQGMRAQQFAQIREMVRLFRDGLNAFAKNARVPSKLGEANSDPDAFQAQLPAKLGARFAKGIGEQRGHENARGRLWLCIFKGRSGFDGCFFHACSGRSRFGFALSGGSSFGFGHDRLVEVRKCYAKRGSQSRRGLAVWRRA